MKKMNGLNWKKWTLRVVLVVMWAALMSAASMLKAQDGPAFGEHHPPMERALGPKGEHARWWNNPEMITKLSLTDAQRKDMDSILDQQRLKLVDLHANVDKAELTLEPLMKADQPDEGKILAQIDRIADARKELEKANARFLLAIRSKLTPEQWKQLEAMRAARHAHEGNHGGPDGRGSDGRGPEGHGGWQGQQRPGQLAPPPPPSGNGPGNGADGAQKSGPGPNPGFDAPFGGFDGPMSDVDAEQDTAELATELAANQQN